MRAIEPPLGGLYEVDGRRLALHRAGSGTPAVVFLPGAGLIGLEYLGVQERAAELTTSIVYDRGGTGWSDPVDLPRTAAAVAGELRELLRTAGVPGPYLLAGHSMGALYARRFAQLFPADVAGLLLLDPGHEDLLSALPAKVVELNEELKPGLEQLPELTAEQLDASRQALRELYAQWPADVRTALVEHRLTTWRVGLQEARNLDDEIAGELRGGGPVPDVPLIVLTAAGRNPYWATFLSEELMAEAHEGIRTLHASIAASVPRGEQRPVEGASHQYLHVERPGAVLDSIRDLLTRAA